MAKRRLFISVFTLVLMLSGSSKRVLGTDEPMYQEEQWSEPRVLATQATDPIVVADSAGDLHVFFVGKTEDDDEQAARSIFYMSRIKDQWAPPLDVLFSPDSEVSLNGAVIDADGNLHLSWNDAAGTYHSRTHANSASNAGNWDSNPVQTGRRPTGELVQGADGRLHLILAIDFASVVYQFSENGGVSWSEPMTIDGILNTEDLAIGGAQIAVDTSEGLHATWYQTSLEADWNPWSVWYARSSDDGLTWQVAEMATPLFGESDIAIDGDDNVHLVYGRNIGYADGRWHQWSQDHGVTWSIAKPLFVTVEYASGSTGGYGFAADGNGRLHLVNSYGDRNGDASAWHLIWQGERWSTPSQILDTRYHAHFPRLAITEGNQLNFLATSARMANFGLFESSMLIDSGHVAGHPLPLPVQTLVVQGTPVSEMAGDYTTPAGSSIELSDEARTAPPTKAPFDSLLIAVGTALIVILLSVLIVRRFSPRRSFPK